MSIHKKKIFFFNKILTMFLLFFFLRVYTKNQRISEIYFAQIYSKQCFYDCYILQSAYRFQTYIQTQYYCLFNYPDQTDILQNLQYSSYRSTYLLVIQTSFKFIIDNLDTFKNTINIINFYQKRKIFKYKFQTITRDSIRNFMKKSVPEIIFAITNNINSFGFIPGYLVALSLCFKLALDILCRNMAVLQQNMFLFDFLNKARTLIYFHDSKLYNQTEQNFLISTIMASLFSLLLIISITLLNLNTEKKKHLINSVAKSIILINYVLSSLIFSFACNLMVQCFTNGKLYCMPIFLLLLILNLMCNLFLEIFMCTWIFKKNSILYRACSKLEIVKYLFLRVIQIYFAIRKGFETYNQFAVASLLLLILDGFTLRSYFKSIYYYHENSRKIHLDFLVVEFVFNLLIVVNILQIQLLNQNMIFGLIFGSFFMIFSTETYYNYFKFQIITKQLKEISNQNEAIMYMRFIDELIEDTNNDQNALALTGIITCHTMNCINLDCQCKSFPSRQKLYSKINSLLIKRYFSYNFKQLFNQFPSSPQVLVTWLNFSLDVCSQYTNYIPQLQAFFLTKKKIIWRQTLLFLQGAYSFEKFIEQQNIKEKSIDTESTFMVMDTLKQIKQEMMKSAHNFSERWRIICSSFCTINAVQNTFNAVLNNMKKMNQHWKFIKARDIRSIEIYTVFYLYYYIIVNESTQYKPIKNLIQNLQEYLKGIKYIDLNNLRHFIFNENACNVQTPISTDTIGIIGNCTNNCESVLGISKKQLQGKNIKFLMPSTLAKCHDKLLENWMKTGTKRSINKVKRVYGIRGSIYKELFACDLYLKLYSNTGTHKLSFVASLVLRNTSDYVIINPDMLIQGYGSKLKSIMPRNIMGQPFTQFSSSIYQLWMGANDNEVPRITIIKQQQETRNVIKLYKIKMLISQYLMAGKKFLLLKLQTISKPSYIQPNQRNKMSTTSTMIAQNKFSFQDGKTIEPMNGSVDLSQSQKTEPQNLAVQKNNNNYKNNDASSVASSIDSSNYSFTKIRIFCLEKFYDSNKIEINCLKAIATIITIGLVACMLIQWYQINNSQNKLQFYGDIIKKANKENYIFLMEAVLFNQMLDIKSKYGKTSQQQFKKITDIAKLINIRSNNILSTNFLNIHSENNLIDRGITTQFQAKTLYKINNDSVNIQFLQFAKLQQATIQQLLYGEINPQKIEQVFSKLDKNWGSILQLVLTGSKQSFESLFELLSIDKLKMYAYSLIVVSLLFALILIISWHNFNLIQRKIQILLINEIIPFKYSELKRQYYLEIKEILKSQNIQHLSHIATQDSQETYRSKSMVSIQHKQNYLILLISICLFFILILTPQIALLSATTQVFMKQQQIGYMTRQLLQLQEIIFATYTSAHYQIVNQQKSNVFNILESNFTDLISPVNEKLESLYIKYNNIGDEKVKNIEQLVKMNLCQLLRSTLSQKQMKFCLELDQTYTMSSKGLFLSMQQFVVYTKQILASLMKKQKIIDSSFNLKFETSIYFIFLGYQTLNLVASDDLSQLLLKQFRVTDILLVLHILACVFALMLWMFKSWREIRTYSNLFGYAMLYPLQLIKNNKIAYRILQQNIFKSF